MSDSRQVYAKITVYIHRRGRHKETPLKSHMFILSMGVAHGRGGEVDDGRVGYALYVVIIIA